MQVDTLSFLFLDAGAVPAASTNFPQLISPFIKPTKEAKGSKAELVRPFPSFCKGGLGWICIDSTTEIKRDL